MAPTPRTIFIRHGQTEWSKSGQYTSHTDLPLTEFGVNQMRRTGEKIFSSGFIIPEHITHIFTSPRTRARQTVDLVLETLSQEQRDRIEVIVDEDLREWEYGDYEGMLTKDIIALRAERGLDTERPWNIWRDGCENGESTEEFGYRLSGAISRIQDIHRKAMDAGKPCDVLVFAHGHALRYFAGLWFRMGVEAEKDGVKYRYLNDNPNFLLDAGGIGALSYAHHSIDEPAMCLSGVVPGSWAV